MTRRSIFPHSVVVAALLAGCVSSPNAVMHVAPMGGETPKVDVYVCPVGTATVGGSCAGPSEVLDGTTTQTRTAALFDHGHDGAVAVMFTVTSSGGTYCSQIASLDLSQGNLDFDVDVAKCSLTFARISATPTDCAMKQCTP